MIRKIALALWLIFSAPAFAADTITVTMTSDGAYVGTLSKTLTFTVSDLNLFQAYLLSQYPCQQPCADTLPLSAAAWLNAQKAAWVSSVTAWQKANAATTATNAVVPINPN